MIDGLSLTGGVTALATKLRPEMFVWDAVGWSQIGAWMIAGIGSIFATQHVIQALYTVPNVRAAQKACFYCAAAMVPFGILTAAVDGVGGFASGHQSSASVSEPHSRYGPSERWYRRGRLGGLAVRNDFGC